MWINHTWDAYTSGGDFTQTPSHDTANTTMWSQCLNENILENYFTHYLLHFSHDDLGILSDEADIGVGMFMWQMYQNKETKVLFYLLRFIFKIKQLLSSLAITFICHSKALLPLFDKPAAVFLSRLFCLPPPSSNLFASDLRFCFCPGKPAYHFLSSSL